METCQSIEKPADIGTRGMPIENIKESGWLNGPAWLKKDEKWPKPWWQVIEDEDAQAISTKGTENELD